MLADSLGQVGRGVVTDPSGRRQIDIDVAAVEPGSGAGRPAVALLGEAKWGTTLGRRHLERLEDARAVLGARGLDVSRCRLAGFGAAGFSDALRAAAGAEVVLVSLGELYGG